MVLNSPPEFRAEHNIGSLFAWFNPRITPRISEKVAKLLFRVLLRDAFLAPHPPLARLLWRRATKLVGSTFLAHPFSLFILQGHALFG